MLVYFPTPYPDELFYSIIGRYKKWTGEINHRSMLIDLFGNGSVTASVDLPSNIGRLVERLPITTQITVEQLIHRHTMFPLYSAFLPSDQAQAVFQSMAYGNGSEIYMRSGIMASSIRLNKHLRHCTDCLARDTETYGEGYWHRMHQIPGLDVCIEHQINLRDSTVRIHQANKHEFITVDDQNCLLDGVVRKTPMNVIDSYRSLSKNIETLLNHKFPNRPLDWFEQYYLSKLQNLGYASIKGGKVNQERLQQDVISFYSEDFLERLQSGVFGEENWISQISRKHRKSFHPIRHLLFLQFFNSNLKEAFYQKESYKPFGEGPWLCLNPAADHFETNVIEEVTLTVCEKTKEPLGTFTCSCEFIYTRKVGEDPRGISRVKQFGAIWEAECIRLSEVGLSLREIGRRLHADPNTVKKCLFGSRGEEKKKKEVGEDKQLELDQSEWKLLQVKHPNLSKTELRRLDPALYIRLYRADRAWLGWESPRPKERIMATTRVNWHERDQEIAERVKEAVTAIKSMKGKPNRICRSAIGHAIDRKAILEKHLEKLPLTKAYLEQVIETDEKYRKRKIKWAVEELKGEGKTIMNWEVLRRAGIRPEFGEMFL